METKELRKRFVRITYDIFSAFPEKIFPELDLRFGHEENSKVIKLKLGDIVLEFDITDRAVEEIAYETILKIKESLKIYDA